MGKFCDLTGKKYGRLLVLNRAPNQNKSTMWHCLCDCGVEKNIRGSHLTSGAIQSCGCLNLEKIRERNQLNHISLVGQRFGTLTVIEDAGYDKIGHSSLSRCKCDCGAEVIVKNTNLKSGNTTSCGCKSSISQGEQIIEQLLKSNNILYQREYTPKDLGFKGRYDFAIFDEQGSILYIIEYDGKQHFDSYGEGPYKSNRVHDLLKNQYCYECGIPLIRIPYIIKNITFDDIWFESSKFIMKESLEKDYYAI